MVTSLFIWYIGFDSWTHPHINLVGIAINLPFGDGLAPIYGDFGDGVLFS